LGGWKPSNNRDVAGQTMRLTRTPIGKSQPASRCRAASAICLPATLGISLTLGQKLLNQRLDGALNQDAQDLVRVQADCAGHVDRLGEDAQRGGSLGGDALDPADQRIDGGGRSVWHGVSMTDDPVARVSCLRVTVETVLNLGGEQSR
jgi:hypothetical protein